MFFNFVCLLYFCDCMCMCTGCRVGVINDIYSLNVTNFRSLLAFTMRHIPTKLHQFLTSSLWDYVLCTIIFKCLHQTAQQYLQKLCIPVTASTVHRHLRFTARGDLKCLPVVLPVSDCAALLPALENCGTICHHHFVIQHWHFSVAAIKTYLFGSAYERALVTA